MTEKRFTKQEVYDGINRYQINDSNFIVEILDDGIPMHYSTIVNRLNEQHEQINTLRESRRELISANNEYRMRETELAQELSTLVDENEQLKKELKKYTDAFDCSQCRFQNYDWFDDGDEFEVCEKGNNEAQMENHSCSEWEEI